MTTRVQRIARWALKPVPWIVVLVLFGVSLGAIALAYHATANQGQVRHIQTAQELSLVEGCERLNALRIQDNVSHLADYHVYSFIAARFLAPTKTETVQQKVVTAEFAAQLEAAVRAKTWTPSTNCMKAVNEHGVAYQAPASVPFYKQLPPPSALK